MRKIWIDTDLDADDIMSIILLNNSKQVSIEGISISATGAISSNKKGIQKALELREILKANFLIFEGANKYFGKNTPKFPIEIRKQSEKGYLKKPKNMQNKNWFKFNELFEKISEYPDDSLEWLSIGTATNISFLMSENPKIQDKFKNIYFSGGNLIQEEASKISVNGSLGNVKSSFGNNAYCTPFCSPYDNDVAEWNVFGDIDAFQFMIKNYKKNIWMVPLNATNNWDMDAGFLKKISHLKTQSGKLFNEAIRNIKESKKLLRLWDQGTTMIFLMLENFTYINIALDVNTDTNIDNDLSGKLMISDCNQKNINFVYEADITTLKNEIISLLNN